MANRSNLRSRLPWRRGRLESDVLELLERNRAIRALEPLSVEDEMRTDLAAREAFARIVATPPQGATVRSTSAGRRYIRLLPVVAIVAVAAAVGALLVNADNADHLNAVPELMLVSAPTPPMMIFGLASNAQAPLRGHAAASELGRLAAAASAQPEPGHGDYQYLQLARWTLQARSQPAAAGTFIPMIMRRHVFPDGRSQVVERSGPALDKAGMLLLPIGGPLGQLTVDPIPRGGPNYPDALPTDPGALASALAAHEGCAPGGSCTAAGMFDLYGHWVISPALASALWRALAVDPEVGYLGATTDRLGRRAVGFALQPTRAGTQSVIFANAANGRFLGYETLEARAGTDGHAKTPAVVGFTVLVSAERMPRMVRSMNAGG